MSGRITIFGYGPTGQATAKRLEAMGRETVIAQRSKPAALPRGATFVAADALDRESVLAAARGSEQIVVAIGFPYVGKLWREVWPKAIGNFVAACEATGARMVFIDNLYMYGPQTAPLVETMPLTSYGLKPAARSAATRVWTEAAAAGRARVAALRPPDFTGRASPGPISARRPSARSPAASLRFFIGSPDIPHDLRLCAGHRPGGDDVARRARFRLRSGLAHALRADLDDATDPADRGRRARRPAAHPHPARSPARADRALLAVHGRNARDALPMGPPLPGRRDEIRQDLLVGRDAVRDGRARNGAVVPEGGRKARFRPYPGDRITAIADLARRLHLTRSRRRRGGGAGSAARYGKKSRRERKRSPASPCR